MVKMKTSNLKKGAFEKDSYGCRFMIKGWPEGGGHAKKEEIMREKNVAVFGRVMVIALLAILVVPNNGSAQPQPPLNALSEEIQEAFMAHEDANGDGVVTSEEFKGDDTAFSFFDQNSDGIIEMSEAPTPDHLPEGTEKQLVATEKAVRRTATINNVDFSIPYDVFSWTELPGDVVYERQPIRSFTNAQGITHYYGAVNEKVFIFTPFCLSYSKFIKRKQNLKTILSGRMLLC